MEKITIADVDAVVDSSTVKRPLTELLDAANIAINYYELAPGDSFAYGYHKHEKQEELFLIHSGTVTFETEGGEVHVAAGDAIRFGAGEFQQGTNRGSERVTAIVIGAPRDGGESVVLRDCERCGRRTRQSVEWADDRAEKLTVCEECGETTGRFR